MAQDIQQEQNGSGSESLQPEYLSGLVTRKIKLGDNSWTLASPIARYLSRIIEVTIFSAILFLLVIHTPGFHLEELSLLESDPNSSSEISADGNCDSEFEMFIVNGWETNSGLVRLFSVIDQVRRDGLHCFDSSVFDLDNITWFDTLVLIFSSLMAEALFAGAAKRYPDGRVGGGSLGKVILNIRVIDANNGMHLKPRQFFIRWSSLAITFIAAIWFDIRLETGLGLAPVVVALSLFWSRYMQGLHDRAAGTLVVLSNKKMNTDSGKERNTELNPQLST